MRSLSTRAGPVAAAAVLLLALCACLLSGAQASRFNFELASRSEECFYEEVNARASDNKVLFRFGILEPKSYDFVDVTVKNPSGHKVQTWKAAQNNFATIPVRESGLYHVCVRKLKGASSKITVFYAFDFIHMGSRSLTVMPNIAGTVSKKAPSVPSYTEMKLSTEAGEVTSMGIMEFELVGISRSVIRGNTRVQLLLTVASVEQELVDIGVALLPDRMKYPVTWETLGSFATGGYRQHVFDNAVTELGSHVAFDITELFSNKLDGRTETLAFAIFAHKDGGAVVSSVHGVAEDYYPQIVVEDLGLDLMREVGFFKESVFTLRGDISFILHRERGTRNIAESTNSRVKWLSLITNVVLVGIAFGQVIYIRSLLESGY